MADIDFPNSPAIGDIFQAGTSSYRWNGAAWLSNNLGQIDWDAVADKPSTFPPSAHTHAIADVTGLQTELDGKAASIHTHVKADITDFAHTHAIADVTGLQDALDAKQDALPAVSTKTEAYTLAATDTNDLIQANGTFTITAPSATFTAGARVDVINIGTGVITFAGSGVTISSKDSKVTINKQFAAATLFFTSATTAVLVGDLA